MNGIFDQRTCLQVPDDVYRKNEWSTHQIETRMLKREPGETVIILEDLDLAFDRKELEKIRTLWLNGVTMSELSKHVKRKKDELFLALFHLSLKNNPRKPDEAVVLDLSRLSR